MLHTWRLPSKFARIHGRGNGKTEMAKGVLSLKTRSSSIREVYASSPSPSLLSSLPSLLPQEFLASTAEQAYKQMYDAMVMTLAPQSGEGYARPQATLQGKLDARVKRAETSTRTATNLRDKLLDAVLDPFVVAQPIAENESKEEATYNLALSLYSGNACPWCHRVLLVLSMRNLINLHPSEGKGNANEYRFSKRIMGANGKAELLDVAINVIELADAPQLARKGGWVIKEVAKSGGYGSIEGIENHRAGGEPCVAKGVEQLYGETDLFGVYKEGFEAGDNRRYEGKCTAPLLAGRFRCLTRREEQAGGTELLSNESAEIVRFFNAVVPPPHVDGSEDIDFCPPHLRNDIDELNRYIYDYVSNAVYRCGFSLNQEAYDNANAELVHALGTLNERLGDERFLLGDRVTESDLMLLPTILRFDSCYATLFRAGKGRRILTGNIDETAESMRALPPLGNDKPATRDGMESERNTSDFSNLERWARLMWSLPGVADTIDIGAASFSYHKSLFMLNPSGIIQGGIRSRKEMEEELGLHDVEKSGNIDCYFYVK